MTSPADDLTLRQMDEILIAHFEVDNLLSLAEVSNVGNQLTELAKKDPRAIWYWIWRRCAIPARQHWECS